MTPEIITSTKQHAGFTPLCMSCKVPVEQFTFIPKLHRCGVWATCHGKTEYHEISIDEMLTKKYLACFRKRAFNRLNVAPVP